MLPIRTILHATDFSEHSAYAFRLACSLARDHGARLIVLHVHERLGPMPPPPLSPNERQAVSDKLQHIKPSDSTIPVEYQLEEGDPVMALLQVARERRCQLVVLGTHGRTGWDRLLMGSVAERVVRGAPCPVLTVKMPHHPTLPAERPIAAVAGQELVSTKG